MSSSTPVSSQRLISLDQFRGYTVLGMFVVNYLGDFSVVPAVLKHHHDYCSYADTIMPQFLFAVGFAFRLTFERRVRREGVQSAYRRVIARLFGLVLVALVVYPPMTPAQNWSQLVAMGPLAAIAPALKRHWFQTLMHIAVTSLWILPVIRLSVPVRLAFAACSAVLHVLLSWQFNFVWCNTAPNAIDGGPLGFLTWTIPAILGTVACDYVTEPERSRRWFKLILISLMMMAAGWGLSCGTRFYDVPSEQQQALKGQLLAANPVVPEIPLRELPGVAEAPFRQPPPRLERKWNYWMMSQRAGTLSYLMFSAGFSLSMYLVFYFLCEVLRWEAGLFRLLGTNALIAYILHSMVMSAVKPFVPRDSPGWYVTGSLLVFLGITCVFVRYLERNKVFLRL